MSRPVDWTPLDRDRDPVPGDYWQVETSGRRYREVADAIELAAKRLREIADANSMQGEAVEEFRSKALDVAKDIERAETRYRGVGDALVAYAPPLQNAQAQSADALQKARDARERLDQAERRASAAQDSLDDAADDADTSDMERALSGHSAAAADAEADLAAARRLCDDAVTMRDEAADRAINAIKEVEDSGDLNDGWWDNWGSKLVSIIAEWAGKIAAVAGILALAVGWIPIIGQALAAALGTIALVASVVSLVANLTLALTGEGSWWNVALDAISVATFGIGRAISGGARAAYSGTRAASRLSAGRVAASSSRLQAAGVTARNSRAIRVLVGGDDIASVSRSAARNMAQRAARQPALSWTAPLRSARADIAELPANLRTIFNPANLAQAMRQAPGAAQEIRLAAGMRSWDEVAARLYGNSDYLAHSAFQAGLNPAVAASAEVTDWSTRAAVRYGVGATAQMTGSSVDAYQLTGVHERLTTPPAPATTLNLPGAAHAR